MWEAHVKILISGKREPSKFESGEEKQRSDVAEVVRRLVLALGF